MKKFAKFMTIGIIACLFVLTLVACEDRTPTYTITFDSQGGSYIKPITGIRRGTPAQSVPAAPTKDGYVFGGWYREINDNEWYIWNFEASSGSAGSAGWSIQPNEVWSDITLKAIWHAPTQEGLEYTLINDGYKVSMGEGGWKPGIGGGSIWRLDRNTFFSQRQAYNCNSKRRL